MKHGEPTALLKKKKKTAVGWRSLGEEGVNVVWELIMVYNQEKNDRSVKGE